MIIIADSVHTKRLQQVLVAYVRATNIAPAAAASRLGSDTLHSHARNVSLINVLIRLPSLYYIGAAMVQFSALQPPLPPPRLPPQRQASES